MHEEKHEKDCCVTFHEMYARARNAIVKETRNSFSFFRTNKHVLFLDTVRVIISRQKLARVLSTHHRFLKRDGEIFPFRATR